MGKSAQYVGAMPAAAIEAAKRHIPRTSTRAAPKRSTRKPEIVCPMPDDAYIRLIMKPSATYGTPNVSLISGNNGGSVSWKK
jgi:hypothetical protein